MGIGELLKNKRFEKGLTQRDVAKAVKVSEGTVSRWESGKIGNMRRDKIQALSTTLSIDPVVIAKFGAKENAATAVAAGATAAAIGAGAAAVGASVPATTAIAAGAVACPMWAALLGIIQLAKNMMNLIGANDKNIQLPLEIENLPNPIFLPEKDDADMVMQYLLLSDADKAAVRRLIASLAQKYNANQEVSVEEQAKQESIDK